MDELELKIQSLESKVSDLVTRLDDAIRLLQEHQHTSYDGTTGLRLQDLELIIQGNGSPENVVTANVGHIYLRRDGGTTSAFYVKETGTTASGWVNK